METDEQWTSNSATSSAVIRTTDDCIFKEVDGRVPVCQRVLAGESIAAVKEQHRMKETLNEEVLFCPFETVIVQLCEENHKNHKELNIAENQIGTDCIHKPFRLHVFVSQNAEHRTIG